MARIFKKMLLLLWKNWLLQRKRLIQTIIEILVPLLLVSLLVLLRSVTKPKKYDTRTFPEFSPNILSGGENISTFPEFPPNTRSEGKDISTYHFLWSPCGNMALQKIMYATIGKYGPILTENCVDDANQLQRQMLKDANNAWAGIQFDDEFASNGSISKEIRIVLRYPGELRIIDESSLVTTWPTHLTFEVVQMQGPRNELNNFGAIPNYYLETFLMLQEALSMAVIHYHMENAQLPPADKTLPRITMQRFPYPPWISDLLLEILKLSLGMIIWLSFIYTCKNTVRDITHEKEVQLKEIMKIMGLPNWLHWTAWFLKIFIFLLISVVLIVVLLKVSWYSNTNVGALPYTDSFVLFVFMVFYICASITFCFAISVFFSKATIAAIVGAVIWFLSYYPYLVLQRFYHELSLSTKLAAMLASNTAMAFGFQLITMFEGTGEGLQWDTIFSTVTVDDNLTLAHVIMMLIIDTIIYLIIALYVDSVFPGEYGVPQRWYYPFTYSYWCGHSRYSGVEDDITDRIDESNNYEREPADLKAGIKIRHLTKTFKKKKVAVRDLSLNIFEGQITVLLGHNGAGKTTTMSMLTGMLPPTSGTAIINGYDIRTKMNRIRDNLSLCTQHNILYGELTVREHLYFFSKLKGMTDKKEINAEITNFVQLLELAPKINEKTKTLSGGMKRKLCLAIAFCGKSKVCIFDEPTAGMDPAGRRAVWDFMQQQKKDRTILLSTHFMDEADLLGDRIVIMAEGQLQCCGTSFFLKKKYGAGYHLVMEKMPKCDVNTVTNILKRHIPSIQLENDIGSELTYLLPNEQSTVFQKMLQDLETRAREIGIANFGISLTTMEEVFMKVGTDYGEEERSGGIQNTNAVNINDGHLVGGFRLKTNQVIAMIMKKFLFTIRSWKLFLIANLIPVALLIALFIWPELIPNVLEPIKLDLSLKAYRDPVTTFSTNNLTNPYYLQFKKMLTDEDEEFVDWELKDFATNLLELARQMITTIRMRYIFGVIFEEDKIVTLFNNEPFHSPPLALEYTMNTVLQVKMKSKDYRIHFSNHPLPFTAKTQAKLMEQRNAMGSDLPMNIGLSLCLVSSLYVLFYVRERVIKSKHLQFVSGTNVSIYWTTAYLWDFLTFLFTSVCIIITLACFQEGGFSTVEELGRLFLLLILFGFAFLPEIYLLSFRFEVPSAAYVAVVGIQLLLGIMAFLMISLMKGTALEGVANFLYWPLLLIPIYALITGVHNMSVKYSINSMCATYDKVFGVVCETIPACCERGHFLGWNNYGIGKNITFLIITATVLTLILIMIEFRVVEKIKIMLMKKIARIPPTDDVVDTDVLEENRRVRNGEINGKDYSVVLKDLTKYYGKFLAVNQLCLGIKGGECFGLLGVNGAGKTTTFNMMTGDISISSGDAWIYGFNTKTNMKNIHKHISYCPQFDGLLDEMTGKETLIMYCLLRGISFKESKSVADNLAREFDFHMHLNKRVREYSGGNKRKLSAAVACIGDPSIIFLDEPTTGMDPGAKRKLWDVLSRIRQSGKCLVLTSHSMEECEILCTRLTVMVNGTFQCLGTAQHLKNKFSQGYTLTIKVKRRGPGLLFDASDARRIEAFVKTNFPSAILRESHEELLTFYIADTAGLKWSKMFGLMEGAKDSLNIENYSLGQSGLEEIFLYFTKFQREGLH